MSQIVAGATRVRLRLRRVMARGRLLAHVIGDLGPMMGHVIVNSARLEIAARSQRRATASSASVETRAPVTPGALTRTEPRPSGALFVFERAELEAHFCAADVLRLAWSPGEDPVHYSLAEAPWPDPSVALIEAHGAWRLLSDVLELRVSDTGELLLLSRDGMQLRRFDPPVNRAGAWEQAHDMRPGELFTGLGEQAGGADLRGGTFRVWNTDAGGAWGPGAGPLYIGIPVVVSIHPQGNLLSFYENSTRGKFSFGDPGSSDTELEKALVRFAGGQLRTYLIAGSPAHVLDRYSELTGRPAMPPRWALGYHQSRWGYKTERDVREVSRGYASEGLPLSAIHLDIDYMNGYRVFTIDRRRFPNMRALCDELAEREVGIVAIVDPGVKVDSRYALYSEGESLGLFCRDENGRTVEGVAWPGRAAFPDFTDPRTRSWWAVQYRALTDVGIAGAWHDMNEPASISLRGDPTLPLSTRHVLEGRGGDHAEAHNLYGLLMNRSGFEGLAAARPQRRPFIVSRSGWASNQRWAWNWTGDADSTWAAMRQQIATIAGLGMSGVAFSGSDIGGFSGVPDDELYLRWLQMSVFMAFCRTHSVVGSPPREPWRFGEPARSQIGAWIRFRYRLLPHLYTLAHEAALTGAPPVRPVWWNAGDGRDAKGIEDEFLLGDSVLVAPVCEPGAITRRVSLPPGRWRGLFGRAFRDEPAGTEGASNWRGSGPLPVTSGRVPVFVREGAIMALDDAFADPSGPCAIEGDLPSSIARSLTATPLPGHVPHLLSFHCWPDDAGGATGVCFDDEGDGSGSSRFDELTLENALGGATAFLNWRRSGEYRAPTRVRVVLHGFEARSVTRDGEDVGGTSGGVIELAPFERLELSDLEETRGAGPAS